MSVLETSALLGASAALRHRAELGRMVAFRTDFYALPEVAQDALYGIAAELEAVADLLDGIRERQRASS